jgi:hypothetical protein
MQAHDYDPDRYEMRIHGNNITVNIQEFVTGYESTHNDVLVRFLDLKNSTTTVLYYHKNARPVQHTLRFKHGNNAYPLDSPEQLYLLGFTSCFHPIYNYPLNWLFSASQETKVDLHSQESIESSPHSASQTDCPP